MIENIKEQSINVRKCRNNNCSRRVFAENGNFETRQPLLCFLNEAVRTPELVGDLMDLNSKVLKALLNNCEFKNELEAVLGVKAEELE